MLLQEAPPTSTARVMLPQGHPSEQPSSEPYPTTRVNEYSTPNSDTTDELGLNPDVFENTTVSATQRAIVRCLPSEPANTYHIGSDSDISNARAQDLMRTGRVTAARCQFSNYNYHYECEGATSRSIRADPVRARLLRQRHAQIMSVSRKKRGTPSTQVIDPGVIRKPKRLPPITNLNIQTSAEGQ